MPVPAGLGYSVRGVKYPEVHLAKVRIGSIQTFHPCKLERGILPATASQTAKRARGRAPDCRYAVRA